MASLRTWAMSENTNNTTSTGGIGISGALGILFIYLKLTHKIDWSWLWVSAPFWGPLALVIAILLLAVVIGVGVTLGKKFVAVVRKRRS